ncbi:unnamed protein product [Acanthosepion pharaonis]|uniref:Uncharacterized protein n=1 Tax=Acanthosepion pharaonis TaxID=158019 RepID=A0A812D6H1_ACAPH|nr:unnamed protein product [Sepia pharaonis]
MSLSSLSLSTLLQPPASYFILLPFSHLLYLFLQYLTQPLSLSPSQRHKLFFLYLSLPIYLFHIFFCFFIFSTRHTLFFSFWLSVCLSLSLLALHADTVFLHSLTQPLTSIFFHFLIDRYTLFFSFCLSVCLSLSLLTLHADMVFFCSLTQPLTSSFCHFLIHRGTPTFSHSVCLSLFISFNFTCRHGLSPMSHSTTRFIFLSLSHSPRYTRFLFSFCLSLFLLTLHADMVFLQCLTQPLTSSFCHCLIHRGTHTFSLSVCLSVSLSILCLHEHIVFLFLFLHSFAHAHSFYVSLTLPFTSTHILFFPSPYSSETSHILYHFHILCEYLNPPPPLPIACSLFSALFHSRPYLRSPCIFLAKQTVKSFLYWH